MATLLSRSRWTSIGVGVALACLTQTARSADPDSAVTGRVVSAHPPSTIHVASVPSATNAVPIRPAPSPEDKALDSRHLEQALRETEAGLKKDPANLTLLRTQGRILRRQKNHRAALAVYARIQKLDPQDPDCRSLQALLLVQTARVQATPQEAARLLSQAVPLAEQDPAIVRECIAAQLRVSNLTEALKFYDLLPADEAPHTLTMALAQAARQAKLFPEAETLYRAALASVADDPDAAFGLSMTLLDSGANDQALVEADRGLQHASDHPGLLLAKAKAETELGHRLAAIHTYSRLAALAPADTTVAVEQARLLADGGFVTVAMRLVQAHPAAFDAAFRARLNALMEAAEARWRVGATVAELPSGPLFALCYHDIPAHAAANDNVLDADAFVEQLEFLSARGGHFVGASDLIAAARGDQSLPDKAVLLTFDGGYASFSANVLPILDVYGYPAIFSVCPAWVRGDAERRTRATLMSWPQIAAAATHPLCALATLGSRLDVPVAMDPQGDFGPAAATRRYEPGLSAYESEAQFRARIAQDVKTSLDRIATNIQVNAELLSWPDGAWNRPAEEEVRRLGIRIDMAEGQRFGRVSDLPHVERWAITGNPSIQQFIVELRTAAGAEPAPAEHMRGLDVNLDLVVDSSPSVTEDNLDKVVERVAAIGVNTVFVQGFVNEGSAGNAAAVYFPNRLLPVRKDILTHAVMKLKAVGVRVFVTLPTLGVVLPDSGLEEVLSVMEDASGVIRPSTLWAKRLSPFNPQAHDAVGMLYSDLAAHVDADGVLFGADGFLTDREDFNPSAMRSYQQAFGEPFPEDGRLGPEREAQWVELKNRQLLGFTAAMADDVRAYRPATRFARALFAPALAYPTSEKWLAQNYIDALQSYDYVVILAFVEMEDIPRALPWLSELTQLAAQQPDGLDKTVFGLQAFDAKKGRWVRERDLQARIRRLIASGARNVIYMGDDFAIDRPLKQDMSKSMADVDHALLHSPSE